LTYVFDNCAFSKLKHYYPSVFNTLWKGLDQLVADGSLVSTREVWNELQRGEPNVHVDKWIKSCQQIFAIPAPQELACVAEIFSVKHFQAVIRQKSMLVGTPVADPFVIAAARVKKGVVVTEEQAKPNGAKIPNICAHFSVECLNLEQFMQRQRWSF